MRTADKVVHMFAGTSTGQAQRFDFGSGEISVFSQPCPTIPDRENEDSAALLLFDEARAVLAVADGVGGIPGGRQASGHALKVFAKTATAVVQEGGELREAILDGVEAANRGVRELGAGCTTLAVTAIDDGIARCVHVGDSGVLISGQRGRMKHATVAHSPVGYGVEAGLLDESEAMEHEDRNLVSNVLGSADMKIEIGPKVRLAARDTVFVGSDGVLDNVSTDDLVALIRSGPIARASQQLIDTCFRRMTEPKEDVPSKPDDTTFILYRPTRTGAAPA